MNKKTPVILRPNNIKPNKKRTSSVSSQTTAHSSDTTSSVEITGGNRRSKDNGDSEQQGTNDVQYEYMDIRGSEKDENPPAHDRRFPPTPARIRDGRVEDEEEQYVEDSNYHYTNRQPKLHQALQERKQLMAQGRDEGEADEYEDMDCFAARLSGDTVIYQNVQRDTEGAVGGTDVLRSGFDSIQVRVGGRLGEPAAGDRSFDNPDYWHSRIFVKPEAVPT